VEAIMRNSQHLTTWDTLVASYLANRRAFGRRYQKEERILRWLRQYLVTVGGTDLNTDIFDRWRKTFRHLSPNTRRGREIAVYKFCNFRRRTDPRCFLPDPRSFARPRPPRMPMIIDPAQIGQLLEAARALCWHASWYPAVMRLAIVLLYTAGLRRAELARLRLEDVDAHAAVLRIRESKFHKSRWVPLSDSVRRELRQYLTVRRTTPYGTCPTAPLLYSGRGTLDCYTSQGVYHAISRLCKTANIRNSDGRIPRVVDFRHSFAVSALLRWYENGEDVQANLPKLALYMGHGSIVSTAHYLRWMPAVIAQASQRFERSYGVLIRSGAA
jgi:integrase/recombinase XerD